MNEPAQRCEEHYGRCRKFVRSKENTGQLVSQKRDRRGKCRVCYDRCRHGYRHKTAGTFILAGRKPAGII